jgi:hypothetical protein
MSLNLKRISRIGGPGSDDIAAWAKTLSEWAAGATLTEGDVTLLAGFVTAVGDLQTKHNALVTASDALQTKYGLLVTATDALQTQYALLVTGVAELQTQYNLLCPAVGEAGLASVSDFTAVESDQDFDATESAEDFSATESDEDFAAVAAALALTPPTTIDG